MSGINRLLPLVTLGRTEYTGLTEYASLNDKSYQASESTTKTKLAIVRFRNLTIVAASAYRCGLSVSKFVGRIS
ncbi:hypothetical protein NPIL_374241 [Nephila pilipes]|uniref:Uncharacterized protein n=1 Tax=Nephila pilipes TaxID=299642 RepID=A0A8X6TQB0_NEPPI|nr:hypothetical protein NPIL_374241 [Nephila pilipes]